LGSFWSIIFWCAGLNAVDLYRHDGIYAGVNSKAIIALLLGVAPNLPGFLAQIGVIEGGGFWVGLYSYAWFIGLAIAGLVYFLLMGRQEEESGSE
jgi:NCS1 family nucleobase:cation symporter-1